MNPGRTTGHAAPSPALYCPLRFVATLTTKSAPASGRRSNARGVAAVAGFQLVMTPEISKPPERPEQTAEPFVPKQITFALLLQGG